MRALSYTSGQVYRVWCSCRPQKSSQSRRVSEDCSRGRYCRCHLGCSARLDEQKQPRRRRLIVKGRVVCPILSRRAGSADLKVSNQNQSVTWPARAVLSRDPRPVVSFQKKIGLAQRSPIRYCPIKLREARRAPLNGSGAASLSTDRLRPIRCGQHLPPFPIPPRAP